MDPKFQTSFIPKKPIVGGANRNSSPINLFTLLGTVVFIAALAMSGGAFFYQKILVKQIEKNQADLNRAKDDFDPETINAIVRFDARAQTGKKLLESHIAVTPIFDFISQITLESVRFRDFEFTYISPTDIEVEMKGLAQSYTSVALQSDILNEQKNLKETIISDMSLESTGNVAFNVSTKLNAELLSYAKGLSANAPKSFESQASTSPNISQ
jgi:hypothetical protein